MIEALALFMLIEKIVALLFSVGIVIVVVLLVVYSD